MRKMMKNNRMAFAASAVNMFSCADSCCENYTALILDAIIMASIFVVLVSVISLISLLGLIISLLGLILVFLENCRLRDTRIVFA